MKKFALLENHRSDEKTSFLFTNYVKTITCMREGDVEECFAALKEAQAAGLYLVGFFSYEFAYLQEKKLKKLYQQQVFPLFAFQCYQKRESLNHAEVVQRLFKESLPTSFFYDKQFTETEASYLAKFQQVQQHLLDGDSYQVNLTAKYQMAYEGKPLALYQQLRAQQQVCYAAYLDFADFTLLSFSPELFYKKAGEHIFVRPMKGTVARGKDAVDDEAQKAFLAQDHKNKTENIIIVDLLRNDLSRIARDNEVAVPELFQIETFQTVHQMTSKVTARVDSEITVDKLMQGLFPCGSITGAPKVRTMEIIHGLEKMPRHVYTGAIGYITPENDQCFSVGIRTALLDKTNKRVELGVGGGLTRRSVGHDEWEEMHLKAKFLRDMDAPFELIECFLYESGEAPLLPAHMNRLASSAKLFDFVYFQENILSQVHKFLQELSCEQSYKVKLVLNPQGQVTLTADRIVSKQRTPLKLCLYEKPINTESLLFQHKTTAVEIRQFYDAILTEYQQKYACDDVIFYNHQGMITEAARFNLIFESHEALLTPPVQDGLLPGIGRAKAMADKAIIECSLSIADLKAANNIFAVNSVRGMLPAILHEGE